MKLPDSDILEKRLECSEGLTEATEMRRSIEDDAGFTIIELLTVVAILGLLATLAFPAYSQIVMKAKIGRAVADIRTVEKEIVAQFIDTNILPDTLNDIERGTLLDPWGNPYQYLKIGNPGTPRENSFGTDNLNTDFDLFSMGEDGGSDILVSDPLGLDDVVRAGDGDWVGLGMHF